MAMVCTHVRSTQCITIPCTVFDLLALGLPFELPLYRIIEVLAACESTVTQSANLPERAGQHF